MYRVSLGCIQPPVGTGGLTTHLLVLRFKIKGTAAFSQMQDDSNPRQPHKKILPRNVNLFIQIYDDPPNNKTSDNKKYFTLDFIYLIHNAHQLLSTFINLCHSIHLHSQCFHLPLSLLTFPSSSLPFHNISSSVPSIALDIQHFLKPFTVTSGEMCAMPLWSTPTKYSIYISWFYKITLTNKDSQFSLQMILIV